MLDRISPRQKAGILVLIALLLWSPTGISEESIPVITGHSVFYNGETYDRCLASIAGILRSRVMWFNDMVLAERYAGKGTFLFVTEHGGRDPTQMRYLYSEGVFYDFVDPNGARWHVQEAYIANSFGYYNGGNSDPIQDPQGSVGPQAGMHDPKKKQYVWFVELAERPIHDQFAGDPSGPYYHDLYNFLVLVDTCKMRREATGAHNITHDWDDLNAIGHPSNATPHEHEAHAVNLYVGLRPTVVAAGATPTSPQWQAQWATSHATGSSNASHYPCRTDNPATPQDERGCS